MYSEKTYKNYIFWVQVKRVFLIIVLSCIGADLGVLIWKILERTVKVTSFNNMIIIISTIIFFLISLLLTVGTGKQVQDGYWKIAVLRKLTVIQRNLELNNELLKNADKSIKDKVSNHHVIEETVSEKIEGKDLEEKAKAPVSNKKIAKTLKTPEGISK